MRVLIVHHLEPCWEQGYVSNGTSFDLLCGQLAEYLEENQYNRIILTRFEECEIPEEFANHGLQYSISTVHQYAYGWEKEMQKDNPHCRWTEGGNHSEIVLIDDWMLELEGEEVDICGAFDGECIEDLEIALDATEVKYRRIEELIV